MRHLSPHRFRLLEDEDRRVYLMLKEHLDKRAHLVDHDASEFTIGFYDDDDQIPEEDLKQGDVPYRACLELQPLGCNGARLRFMWGSRMAWADFGHGLGVFLDSAFWRGSLRSLVVRV